MTKQDTSPAAGLNIDRISCLAHEIAEIARDARLLDRDSPAFDLDSASRSNALLMRKLMHVGWLADKIGEGLDGYRVGGDADYWMLPAPLHWEAEEKAKQEAEA